MKSVCASVSASEKYRAGLDAKGRHDTVAGAFEVRHPRLVANEEYSAGRRRVYDRRHRLGVCRSVGRGRRTECVCP
jgi:hypothetical protein